MGYYIPTKRNVSKEIKMKIKTRHIIGYILAALVFVGLAVSFVVILR
ncbi:unnamed protein product [marine sediment metagenome]|uniref:Uncharacterized protein n=1 Tax=marine sediment metagenome TaxID=412755 RepID=X1BV85_9ZZZZ